MTVASDFETVRDWLHESDGDPALVEALDALDRIEAEVDRLREEVQDLRNELYGEELYLTGEEP